MKRSQTRAKQVQENLSKPAQSINNVRPRQLPKRSHQMQSVHVMLPSIEGLSNHESLYEFREKIGQGAFAEVRMAKRMDDGQAVVVKTYNKMRLYDKERRKCVQQEISILQTIENQNVIKFLDSYETEKSINIVMEYFSTISLRVFMKQKNKLSQEELRTIMTQLAHTLEYLHSRGIAHRDVKLENILIDKKTLGIKLIDFGFAIKATGPSARSSLIGTPSYLPPEMISSKEYDPFKADVWALGILFYFLCVGYFPFRSVDDKTLQNKIVKGQLIFPKEMNPGCQYLISKMLRHSKEDRVGIKEILEDTWIKPVDFSERIALLRNKGKD